MNRKPTTVKPQFYIFFTLLAALLLTSGCRSMESGTLYNNSGQDLTFVAMYPRTNVAAVVNKSGHFNFYSPFIEVHHSAGVWHYGRELLVSKRRLLKKGPGPWLFVELQIQPNGAIYVIPPDSNGPVTNFPPQPNGFPLVPM